MSKKKTAKRAFISSLLVLAMCFTMLAGTTFAWFTDSVSSANNIIKSGKLDMDVKYYDDDAGSWEPLNSSVALFDDNALFEPGYVQVAYIKIANIGNLAFTYRLSANIVSETKGKNQAGAEFALSDYLKFGTAKVADILPTGNSGREAAIDAVKGTATTLKDINLNSSGVLYPAGSTAGVSDTGIIAVVIYMPTTVGNEANYGTTQPSITLGLNALATQATVEKDSFNNQYDAQAPWPQIAQATLSSDSSLNLTTEEVTVSASNVEAANYKLVVDNKNVATETTGTETATTVSYDITLYKDNVKVTSGATYTVEIDVGVNKNIVSVKHNGADVTGYTYDATSGIITFTTSSFSPFEVVYTNVTTPVATTAVIPSGTIELRGANLDEHGNLDLADAANNGLTNMGQFKLANGVSFTAPATLDEDWADATADFVISFDRNISSMNYNYQDYDFDILPVVPVGKFGDNAGSFWELIRGNWIPCPLASNGYTANTKIALLESVIGASVSYGELVNYIKEFSCGLVFLKDVGTVTINVDLVLTKDDTSYLAGHQSFTINSADYVA